MFAIFNIQNTFHAKPVSMFTSQLHVNYHILSCYGSLVTAFKLKDIYMFHMAAKFLFYILQNTILEKNCVFF
jgi:hypothetical protein